MLPAPVEEAIRAIREDRTSGASKLARLAVDVMRLAITEAKGRPDPKELAEVAQRISAAQPAMAIVHNVTHLVAMLVSEGQDPSAVLEEIRAELESARERIARTFLKIAPQHATIVTLSSSDNVFAAIKAAHARGLVDRVYVMESGPLFEGRTLAKALADAGVVASVVPDAHGAHRVADASCVLVGADSVLRDGAVVNKIGTHGLATAASASKRPFYVACETLKFDARYDTGTWPSAPRNVGDVPAGADDHAKEAYRLFELTPARLITTVVTERGTYTPDVVRTMLSPARDPAR
jgi:translation initiation factor 2B subunit (eIF-2B alpha/beta/delta family)